MPHPKTHRHTRLCRSLNPRTLLQSDTETHLDKRGSRYQPEERPGLNKGCCSALSRSEHDPPGEGGEQRQYRYKAAEIKMDGGTVGQCQTHHTVADTAGILCWLPRGSMIVPVTRVDATCKQVSHQNNLPSWCY